MKKSLKLFLLGIILVIGGVFGFLKFCSDKEVKMEFTEEKEQAVEKKKDVETILVAGGDVMLSRHVGTKIRRSGDNALPFRNVYNIFNEADIAFVNLEAPFYNQGDYVTEGMIFKSEPETIEGLNLAGIDIVSLANNHMQNKGEGGLLYTLEILSENKIMFTGAGNDFEEIHQGKILDRKGIKFSFLAYTYSDGDNFESSASKDHSGVAFMDVLQMKKDVEKARKKSDIVVVSMHAGVEYSSYPNTQQKEFAREAVGAGATLILGHHPHVVQSVEQYNDGFIIYSMGNLIFDQMWSEETREGIIAKCKFANNKLKQIEFIPIKIEDYNQPKKVSGEESDIILKRMGLNKSIIDL